MRIDAIFPARTDWALEAETTDNGAVARTRQVGEVRQRLITFAAGYGALDWCSKGHVIWVVAGTVTIEHRHGQTHALQAGHSLLVPEGDDWAHRVVTDTGATVFLVD